jgi:hypothetical protein
VAELAKAMQSKVSYKLVANSRESKRAIIEKPTSSPSYKHLIVSIERAKFLRLIK